MKHTVTRHGTAVILLLLATLLADAQPSGKVYRIGFIQTSAPNEMQHLIRELDERLRELSYVEGRNIEFERRFAEGKQERLPALAAELVRLNVDVIVTGSNPVISAVTQATATIPVVMAVSRDPVGSGFIASLARTGGFSNDPGPEILGKNMELLKDMSSKGGIELMGQCTSRRSRTRPRPPARWGALRSTGRSEADRLYGSRPRDDVQSAIAPDSFVITVLRRNTRVGQP